MISTCFRTALWGVQNNNRGTRSSCLFFFFQETDVFQFEMDESQLTNVLSSIDEIEKKLASYAQ